MGVINTLKVVLKMAALLCLVVHGQAWAGPKAVYWEFWDKSNESNREIIDHSDWDQVLQHYATLNEQSGVVNFAYGQLTDDDVEIIEDYVDDLEDLDPRRYPKLEQKAYWMNLYNALSVLAVRENYRDLSATNFQSSLDQRAWSKERVKVARQRLSLNDIENRILRPIFKDHRILFGLNCATLDCPNLDERAYTSATIRTQLKEAGHRFINSNTGLQYAEGVLSASRLFGDYMSDFAKDEKTLQKVFAHYARDMKALYVLGYTGPIQFLRDSRLNRPAPVLEP